MGNKRVVIKRQTLHRVAFILLGCSVIIGSAVFYLKYQVSDSKRKLILLQKTLRKNTESIRVLKAEWAYLNRPERLARLNTQHLHLNPMDVIQIASLEKLEKKPTAMFASVAKAAKHT